MAEDMNLQQAGEVILNYAKHKAQELNIEPESAFNYLVASGDSKMHQMLKRYAEISDSERKYKAQHAKYTR